MRIDKLESFLRVQDQQDRRMLSHLLDRYDKYEQSGVSSNSEFLNRRELILAEQFLRIADIKYSIERIHPLCEKVVISFGDKKNIQVLEIVSKQRLKHPEILGSLFGIGLDDNRIGDIFIDDNRIFLTCLVSSVPLLMDQFISVSNSPISLNLIDELILLEEHFEDITLIVSSMRLDVVVSRITHFSRSQVLVLFNDGFVCLNDKVVKDYSMIIHNDDILSIRKFGRFLIGSNNGYTKGQNIILEVKRYK